jgi:hypothetical protein
MNEWLRTGRSLLDTVLQEPESTFQLWVTVILALLGFAIVMKWSAAALGAQDLGWLSRLIAVIVALAVISTSAIAADMYLVPFFGQRALRIACLFVGPLLAMLVIGIIMQSWIMKTGYGETLAMFLMSALAAVLVILAADGVFAFTETVIKESGELKTRREKTEDTIYR